MVTKEIEVLIQILMKDMSKEQKEALHQAELLLAKAGIMFDTGYDLCNNVRDWQFDWSLKGAKVLYKRVANAEV